MTNEKLIQATRSISVETGSLVCLGCGHENNCGIHGCAILRAAADCIEGLSTQLADLQTRFDRVNDFEQSQCAKVMVKLAERDAQLAAAVEDMRGICYLCKCAKPYKFGGGMMVTCEHLQSAGTRASNKRPGCIHWEWRGEQSTDQQPPAWAEQFERRFLGGEVQHGD